MTPTSEFQDFLDELHHHWGSTEGFALRSDYMDRVRASSLTADEVGRLRDEVVIGQPGTPTGQRLDTLRSMLKSVYDSKLREEQRRDESRLIRFVRNHPLGVLLAFLGASVVAAFIALVVGIVFGGPIAEWWEQSANQDPSFVDWH